MAPEESRRRGGRSSDVNPCAFWEQRRRRESYGDREAWAQMRGRREEIRNGALLCLCEYESACGDERNQSALWRTVISRKVLEDGEIILTEVA